MAEAKNKSRNVLICVDGSEHSVRAIEFYSEILCRKGDHVVVLNVPEIPTLSSAPGPYGVTNYDEFEHVLQRVDDEAKTLLKRYGEILKKKQGITLKLVKENGKPGQTICHNCKIENINFIVLGSRGQSTVRRTFLGSVSDYVVHHSHIPVCVVPHKRHEHGTK